MWVSTSKAPPCRYISLLPSCPSWGSLLILTSVLSLFPYSKYQFIFLIVGIACPAPISTMAILPFFACSIKSLYLLPWLSVLVESQSQSPNISILGLTAAPHFLQLGSSLTAIVDSSTSGTKVLSVIPTSQRVHCRWWMEPWTSQTRSYPKVYIKWPSTLEVKLKYEVLVRAMFFRYWWPRCGRVLRYICSRCPQKPQNKRGLVYRKCGFAQSIKLNLPQYGGQWFQKPLSPRKSGRPESTPIPAPELYTTQSANLSAVTAFLMLSFILIIKPMQDKDREQRVSQKLRCDFSKMSLSYYTQRKYLHDSLNSLTNLHSILGFSHPQSINSTRKPLLTNLVHSFKNDKKDREKNSFVEKMAYLKSSKEVVVGYGRPDRGDINFIDSSKPRVVEFFYKELTGGLGGLAPYQDGKRVMIADRKGKFTWIDVVTKDLKEINDKARNTEIEGILDISLSPGETKLACGTKDKIILIFDLEKQMKVQRRFSGHTDTVNSVCWNPYKALLCSCSNDQTVKLWDIRTQQRPNYSTKDHSDTVTKCLFSPDGNTYFSMGKDKKIFQYDIRRRGVITKFETEQEPKDFHVTHQTVVCGDGMGNIRWWSRKGELLEKRKGESGVLALAVDQTENWMVVARKDGHAFQLYEVGEYAE